jgi:hypothetical protein
VGRLNGFVHCRDGSLPAGVQREKGEGEKERTR